VTADDVSFLVNARDAGENGYDLVCVKCGCGMDDAEFEDAEMHDDGCPNRGRDRAEEMRVFLAERLGR
jgi:hypothetical protein